MRGLSLVAENGGYSLVAMPGLLIAAASRCRAWALGTRAAVAVVHGLSCPTSPHLPALASGSGFLTTILPEKS